MEKVYKPDDWYDETGTTTKQLYDSLVEANDKLNRINIYLDELYELNGTSLSWNAAIRKLKAIVMEV